MDEFQVDSGEFLEAMSYFEKAFGPRGKAFCGNLRIDKEPRELWRRHAVYQSGTTNDMFFAFLYGATWNESSHNAMPGR